MSRVRRWAALALAALLALAAAFLKGRSSGAAQDRDARDAQLHRQQADAQVRADKARAESAGMGDADKAAEDKLWMRGQGRG